MSMLMRSQEDLAYQMPPQIIADLMDAPPTPGVQLSPQRQWMLLLERPNLPPIEEVAEEELRLAGLRINPQSNGSSRSYYYNGMELKAMDGGKTIEFIGLPDNPRIENVSWSPDGAHIAFTNSRDDGIELWVVDLDKAAARQLTGAVINDAMRGTPYEWVDNNTLLYKKVLANRGKMPEEPTVPKGPVVQFNDGKVAPVRTYQDLLEDKYDEALFDYFFSARLILLNLVTGEETEFAEPGVIRSFEASPDGRYIMVATLHRPYSYIVPYYRFPLLVDIYDRSGKKVRTVTDNPLAENIPKGFGAVPEGPRSFAWRADAPATLYWVEAQDGGDPKAEADIRDKLYYLEPPFTGDPRAAIELELRYGGVTWGDDELAMVSEWWWTDRREITSRWNPAEPAGSKKVIFDRSWEDSYNDPGAFEVKRNEYGRLVLLMADDGKALFLTGQGASPEGNRPFVDKFFLETGETTRLWRSEAPYYEFPVLVLDPEKGMVLTRRESKDDPPNFFLRNLETGQLQQVTEFKNPYEALSGIDKELVRYQREDGVELTGTLYLPAGYDKEKDGPLPTLMWAYPREYKSAEAASQVKDSPYEFIRLGWFSPLFWVTQGYAIFDGFGMPIVGEGEEEPNETFVEQLRMNAKAAVDKLAEMGVTDRSRIGVGGHSYGAFMTANLLSHTDLFAAGIARSGAYNRTLTPFGFQSEERTYWEAPEVYFSMSPFMHADDMKTPLLLIHGEADNNSGTFPIQSERYYAALKGHGATVRLVMLPHESHGYRSRESIMHMLWEMDSWLNRYVKNNEQENGTRP